MNRNWYPPCSPVVAVLSVLDSALARMTVAPATVLPLGSVMVPRSDVAAWPAARPLIHKAKHARTIAGKTSCRRTRSLLETPRAVDDIPSLGFIGITFLHGVGSQELYYNSRRLIMWVSAVKQEICIRVINILCTRRAHDDSALGGSAD